MTLSTNLSTFGNQLCPNTTRVDTFPRSFPLDGEVANLLRTCYGETGVMDFDLYGIGFYFYF